jgi:hypothetical protein
MEWLESSNVETAGRHSCAFLRLSEWTLGAFMICDSQINPQKLGTLTAIETRYCAISENAII